MPEITPEVGLNIIYTVIAATVVLATLWMVIRSAVLSALERHQRDLDGRG